MDPNFVKYSAIYVVVAQSGTRETSQLSMNPYLDVHFVTFSEMFEADILTRGQVTKGGVV